MLEGFAWFWFQHGRFVHNPNWLVRSSERLEEDTAFLLSIGHATTWSKHHRHRQPLPVDHRGPVNCGRAEDCDWPTQKIVTLLVCAFGYLRRVFCHPFYVQTLTSDHQRHDIGAPSQQTCGASPYPTASPMRSQMTSYMTSQVITSLFLATTFGYAGAEFQSLVADLDARWRHRCRRRDIIVSDVLPSHLPSHRRFGSIVFFAIVVTAWRETYSNIINAQWLCNEASQKLFWTA